jgi:hypothetical protein
MNCCHCSICLSLRNLSCQVMLPSSAGESLSQRWYRYHQGLHRASSRMRIKRKRAHVVVEQGDSNKSFMYSGPSSTAAMIRHAKQTNQQCSNLWIGCHSVPQDISEYQMTSKRDSLRAFPILLSIFGLEFVECVTYGKCDHAISK